MSLKKSENLHKKYALDKTIESFYNGGPLTLTKCGSRLFTNFGNCVKCVDFETGEIRFTLSAPDSEDEVTSFALSPCDEFLVVAYRNTLIVQFRICLSENCANVERNWKSGHRGPVVCLDISEDSRLLATGSGDSTVKIWDLQAQFCTHTLKECTGSVTCVQFAPPYFHINSQSKRGADRGHTTPIFLVYGDDTGKLFVRDLAQATGDFVASGAAAARSFALIQHTSAVTRVAFGGDGGPSSPDAAVLFACGRDAVVSQWDARRNFALKKVTPTFESLETMMSYSCTLDDTVKMGKGAKEEQCLLTGGESGFLKIWSTKTGQCLKKINVGCKGPIKQILQCEVLRCFLIVTCDHVIIKISFDDFTVEGRLIGRNDEIYDVAFCGENLSYAVMATNSSEVRLYNLDTCQCSLLASGHSDAVLALDVADWDPSLLASCSKDSSVAVWRLQQNSSALDQHPLYLATGHAAQVGAVRFSRLKPRAGGPSSFLASLSDDHTLKLWPLPSQAPSKDEGRANLSASSTLVAHEKDAAALDVSPNDRFIATGSMDKTIKLWRVDDPTKLTLSLAATIADHKRGVFAVRFSPTDQVIASASGDFTLKIFSLEDFSCIKTFEGHQATVLRVLFTPSGSQLLSTDSAGLLKLWTIKSNECVQTIDAHEDKIFALCSDPQGRRIMTGGSDSRLVVWRDETDAVRLADAGEKREKIETQQRLANLMSRGQYERALRLAIKLSRPFDAYKIVQKLVEIDTKTFDSLRDDQISVLLSYVTEWNSNSRNFLVGQKMLAAILKCRSPDQLLKMPNIEKAVESLLPYSQRHFERLSRTRQQAHFVDYTWSCMKLGENFTNFEPKIKSESLS